MVSKREVRRSLKNDYKILGNWRLVAAKWGISKGMAYRVAHGYEPKKPHIRLALGLPAYAQAPVCEVHAVVHVGRCPRKAKRDLFAYSKAELAQMIRERK